MVNNTAVIHMRYLLLLFLPLLMSCSEASNSFESTPVDTAMQFLEYSEKNNRSELKSILGVDPVRTEWCAAFVNSILEIQGIPGSESVSETPLMARSFLLWGHPVLSDEVKRGDVVIFPRGNQGWQGHVGFYVATTYIKDEEYYLILGGNQDNKVSYELYPARKALGIRRWESPF